jgi:hypothetical protein
LSNNKSTKRDKMVKLSDKREAFVRNYAVSLDPVKSYIEAGYSPHSAQKASNRLMKNVDVAKRLSEIQAELVAKTKITLETMVNEFKADRDMARKNNNPASSTKANIEIAKLHGLYEVDNSQKMVNPYLDKTREELMEIAKEKAQEIQAELN